MTESPAEAIERFLQLAIELCPAAGSAGLSELVEQGEETSFLWTAMAGAFSSYVGGSTPRDFSPCGLCLDSHHTILIDRPARVFTYFNEAQPSIVEGLIVPLYDTGKRAIGTLWVVSHDEEKKFDGTDARVMEQLAIQLVLAIKLRRKAAIVRQLEQTAEQNETLVHEVRHRVKNMVQMTSNLLELQQRGTESDETRSALKQARSRLRVLADVYESLLQPGADAREVDAGELINSLVHALRDSSPDRTRIEVETSCDEMNLGVSEAVALGLLVNEAVTNSLKHAFAGNEAGKIAVHLSSRETECSLVISDDGRGISGPSRAGSLGMRLMNRLARQVGAVLDVDGSKGTTIALRWKKRSDGAPARSLPLRPAIAIDVQSVA